MKEHLKQYMVAHQKDVPLKTCAVDLRHVVMIKEASEGTCVLYFGNHSVWVREFYTEARDAWLAAQGEN